MKDAHLLHFALEHPWAVTDSMRHVIAGILIRHAQLDPQAEANPVELNALVNRSNLPQPRRGGVAVIPMYGVVAPRVNTLTAMSGGTSFEALTTHLHEALADPAVATIVFDVDSPGGNVAGATEFAAEIRAAREIKPVIAVAQFLMASAAYWAMSGATSIVAAPSARVGSIGVVTMHNDISAALEKNGIKREVFFAGKFKGDGFDGGPLGAESRAFVQAAIDASYGMFVGDIAKGRKVAVSAVRNGYGEGRVISATEAIDAGMVDKIGTLAETLAGLLPKQHSTSPTATAQEPPREATAQEREADVHWQNAFHSRLLSLEL